MFLTQPSHGTACPEPVKTLGSLDIGPFIKAAVAGKYTARSKYACHQPECRELVGEKVNGVTEESSIGILHDFEKITRFSLDKSVCIPEPCSPASSIPFWARRNAS